MRTLKKFPWEVEPAATWPSKTGVPYSRRKIRLYLKLLPGWRWLSGKIVADFQFKNYTQTVAFVRATARIAEQQDHHPEISFGYKTARVTYVTHSINGISEKDFRCAAKISRLA